MGFGSSARHMGHHSPKRLVCTDLDCRVCAELRAIIDRERTLRVRAWRALRRVDKLDLFFWSVYLTMAFAMSAAIVYTLTRR